MTRAHALTNLLTGAVFAAFLALPALDMAVGLDRTPPPQEKRKLAPEPGFPHSLDAWADYPAAADAYLADHFGFRSFLVRLHARATVLWLGVTPSPQVEVLVGRRGCLFYTGDRSLPYIEGTNPFTEEELQRWTLVLKQRSEWLARRGVRYLVVFAPGSPSIYPEYLPGWVRPSSHGTRLDQLLEALKAAPEVSAVDLRPALREAKAWAPLYSQTDTHWNLVGGWVAYSAIMTALEPWFPGARPAPFSTFNVAWGRRQGGDLATMAGIQGMITEPVPWLAPKRGWQAKTVPSPEYTTLRPFPPRQGPVVTVRAGAPIPGAVIFRDSFSMALAPFLSEDIGRAVYLWTYEFEPSVVVREQPALVIQEYAERLLSVISPANPPELTAGPTVKAGNG